jgi:DNA polymerase lambda
MGSYRRGAKDSGDVDFLITRDDSDGRTHAGVLEKLIARLMTRGVVTHSVGV